MSKKNVKGVGSTTSFTIPSAYKDVLTGEKKEVSKELLDLINYHGENRSLVHLILTALDHLRNSPQTASQAPSGLSTALESRLDRIEKAVDLRPLEGRLGKIEQMLAVIAQNPLMMQFAQMQGMNQASAFQPPANSSSPVSEKLLKEDVEEFLG